MIEVLIFLLIVALFVAPFAALFYLHELWHDGILDVKYPLVANKDYRTGWRRRIYLAGRRRGEFLLARDKERRRLTAERQGKR